MFDNKKINIKKSTCSALIAFGLLSGVGYITTVNADEVPQTVNIGNSQANWVTASQGTVKSSLYNDSDDKYSGYHRVNIIQEAGTGEYIFCVQWSKAAPSNQQVSAKFQADPKIQWLVTNFNSGHRYRSLNQGDLGDYWLYQAVIHMIASPNEEWGGDRPDAYFDRWAPSVQQKVRELKAEAERHTNLSDSEEILNTHTMSFNPDHLQINGDDLHGNSYTKDFVFNSSNMSNVKVWLEGQPKDVTLSGSNGGVNFNDVWNDTGLRINIPYKTNADKDEYSFKVKSKGNWNKKAKVAYIYGDQNNNVQNVAKCVVKATTVPLDAEQEMNVTVRPAKGRVSFVKKGSGNNNQTLLPNTEFTITGDGFSQTRLSDETGRVSFDNLPLGRDYHVQETKQPNGFYRPEYSANITSLNGTEPQKEFSLGDVVNIKAYQNFEFTKKNANGASLEGAQFVLVPVINGIQNNLTVDEALKNAYRQDGDKLTFGDNSKEVFRATSDKDGKVKFKNVQLLGRTTEYYAVEVKAPNGYDLSLEPLKVHATSNSPDTVTGELVDTTNPLPSTGSKKVLISIGVVLSVIGMGLLGLIIPKKLIK